MKEQEELEASKTSENRKSDKEADKKSSKKITVRTCIGIGLIVAGCILIISVFVVPALNRRNNDKDIEDIRAGKYAKYEEYEDEPVESATPEAVTQEAVQELTQRELQMAQILADDTRMGIVEIEKIDVLYAIVEGTEDEQINRAVGHLKGSAGIGQKGNCVIAGHRGGYYGTFFERLPELEPGDEVVLTDLEGKEYRYVVYDKQLVEPADWSVTKDLADMSTLTLITCEDDTRKRIVVMATLYEP